jgi:tyrosinase
MAKLPAKTPKSECPGCKNRYDDFVATHIKQTFSVSLIILTVEHIG